jgi:hypothetical protein
MPLEVSLLCRAKGLIKKNLHCPVHLGKHHNLIRLSATNKQGSVGRLAFTGHAEYRLKACRFRKQPQFLEVTVEMFTAKINTNQDNRCQAPRNLRAHRVARCCATTETPFWSACDNTKRRDLQCQRYQS